jgi:hypothetical protein
VNSVPNLTWRLALYESGGDLDQLRTIAVGISRRKAKRSLILPAK